MEQLSKKYRIFNEVGLISSANQFNTLGYSMADCDAITFICGYGTAAASATAIVSNVTIRMGGDKALSTSTTVGGATATLGPTTALQIANVKSAVITMGTASTLTDTLIINGETFTYSTAPAATSLNFGSTEGSTVAEGITKATNSLSSVINASTRAALLGLQATTISTAAIRIVVDDTASTSLSITSTADANFAIVQEKQQAIVRVKAEDLNSTSAYVLCRLSTCATSVPVSVTVIKEYVRHLPPFVIGQDIEAT